MGAKAQLKKEKVIADLVEARTMVLEAAAALSPAQQDEVFLGTWSVKDLLAHLVGWDYANLEAAQAILAGQRPAFWVHYDRDWKTFNARLVAEYRRDDFAELVASVEDSHRRLIAFLETIPAEDFFRAHGRDRISTLLRVEARDERKHCAQIQEFAGR